MRFRGYSTSVCDNYFSSPLWGGNEITYVDFMLKAAEEYKVFNISVDNFIERFYVEWAGAQVFGHYNPYGNFWFAYGLENELVEWLDPKPLAYAKD